MNDFNKGIQRVVITEGGNALDYEAGIQKVELAGTVNTEKIESDLIKVTSDLAQTVHNVMYKKVYLTEQGLIGDGVLRSISSFFPSVTLGEVQNLNPNATLNNSADWYIIQKLINTAENYTSIIIDGQFIVDLDIIVNRRYLSIEGKDKNKSQWIITSKADGKSLFKLGESSGASYTTMKNFIGKGMLDNATGKKNLHGVELARSMTALYMENCEFNDHGGYGFKHTSGHFVMSTIKDCTFNGNFESGLRMKHLNEAQCNGIFIENINAHYNGKEYVNGKFSWLLPEPVTNKGHGLDISGAGVSVIKGVVGNNASAGIYVNDGFVKGLVVQSVELEVNPLSDIYVTSGTKNNFKMLGNYTSSKDAKFGEVYFEGSDKSIGSIPNLEIPIRTYVHRGNKEVRVTDVNISNSEFESVGHGLIDGDTLFPIINENAGNVYPLDKYVGGITGKNYPGYYVVGATTDTFKLSTTNGGSPITLSSNANMDLNKWHFETKPSDTITLSDLPVLQKCKIEIKGKMCQMGAACYISPYHTESNYLSSTRGTYGLDNLQITGDVYVDVEIIIDSTNLLTKKVKGITVNSNTSTSNTTASIDKIFVNPLRSNTTFDQIMLQSFGAANGLNVNVYALP